MSYNLTLKIVSDKEMIDIQVTSTDTILQVKQQVDVAWNVPAAEQILFISTRCMILQDEKTLADYGIVTDGTIDFRMHVP
jgi:uncharacterized ubiquitin-like protein YukD